MVARRDILLVVAVLALAPGCSNRISDRPRRVPQAETVAVASQPVLTKSRRSPLEALELNLLDNAQCSVAGHDVLEHLFPVTDLDRSIFEVDERETKFTRFSHPREKYRWFGWSRFVNPDFLNSNGFVVYPPKNVGKMASGFQNDADQWHRDGMGESLRFESTDDFATDGVYVGAYRAKGVSVPSDVLYVVIAFYKNARFDLFVQGRDAPAARAVLLNKTLNLSERMRRQLEAIQRVSDTPDVWREP